MSVVTLFRYAHNAALSIGAAPHRLIEQIAQTSQIAQDALAQAVNRSIRVPHEDAPPLAESVSAAAGLPAREALGRGLSMR